MAVVKVVITVFVLWSATAWGANQLSFSEAVEQMLRQNPKLSQLKFQTEISRLDWKRSKASYLPQLDFLQTLTRSNNPVYAFGSLLNQQNFTEQNFSVDSLNHPDPLTNISSQFQIGWLIYDFGRRESLIDSAESAYRIASFEEKSLRLALLNELVRRYYIVSLSEQKLVVAQEALRSAESRLQQARDRVAEGVAVQSDELAAEVYRSQRAQEAIDAEHQVQFSVAALSELLGIQHDSDIATAEMKELSFPEVPLAVWVEQMQQARPELKIVTIALNISQQQLALSRSAFLPSLQAWSNYQFHGDSFDYSGNNWGAGVELRWNLFRGFSDTQQYSAAKLQEKVSLQKEREVNNALVLQLKKAYFDYLSAKEKLMVASAAVKQAAESKRIYSDRYSAGMVTIQDSLQADAAYNEARLRHVQVIYDIYVAYASLLAAAGKEEEIKMIGVQS